jgi:ribokinase
MQSAVVGHTEWITFADVDAIPQAGGIAHTSGEWETPGGGGAVAAVQLAKLAESSTFFTAVGDDDIGARTRRDLTEMGVAVRAATRSARSRRALTMIDAAGERTILTLGERLTPAAADPLSWNDLDATDAVYVTAGDAGALAHARRARVMVVTSRILDGLLDSGVVPDALVGSARDPAEAIDVTALPWQPSLIVRTEGARGGSFRTAEGAAGRWDPAPVRPGGDMYGAGDSFAAGLAFGLAEGLEPREAVDFAARCGAGCASARGPYAGQLTAAGR